MQLFKEDDFNRTDNVYSFPQTKSIVEFFGADDTGKTRGPGRDILFCNEANLLDFAIYKQLALRTKGTIFIDFNPADLFNWVYEVSDDKRTKLIISNYTHNLANISKEQREEIESLKDADFNLWQVYGLGLRGTSSETIYTHWKIIETLPDLPQYCYGLDFGYNNPSALVKIGIKDNAVYIDELLYETKLTTQDLTERIKAFGITRTDEIYCDAAEPKTIEELHRMGLNAKPADKSVYDGIMKVKAHPLYITRRSTNTIKEIKSYKWMIDKNGIVQESPVKFQDHALDASRYAIYSKMNRPKRKLIYSA